jgi:hypothetical protein
MPHLLGGLSRTASTPRRKRMMGRRGRRLPTPTSSPPLSSAGHQRLKDSDSHPRHSASWLSTQACWHAPGWEAAIAALMLGLAQIVASSELRCHRQFVCYPNTRAGRCCRWLRVGPGQAPGAQSTAQVGHGRELPQRAAARRSSC